MVQPVDGAVGAADLLGDLDRREAEHVTQDVDLALVPRQSGERGVQRASALGRVFARGIVEAEDLSVDVARRTRTTSTATLWDIRSSQATNGTSRCSYLEIAVMSLANTCWVTSLASW